MSASLAYLETQVRTATPPKLRLLLIQAALRLAQNSLQSWTVPLPETESLALTQLRKILTQLLTSLDQGEDEIGSNLQRVYIYLLQAVTLAQLSGDSDKLRDVIEILKVEQQTWQALSQRYVRQHVNHTGS